MELKNTTLAAIFITLLITGIVESAGDDGALPFLAPLVQPGISIEALQQGRDRFASSNVTEEIGEGAPSVSVEAEGPLASDPDVVDFIEALQSGNMMVAHEMFKAGCDELTDYYTKYLVSLEGSKLIELTSGVGDNMWILQIILVHARRPIIDRVLGALNASNESLREVARSADLACSPLRFVYFLGRIDDKENQVGAVENGIRALVDGNKTECLDPLLTALGKGTFLSADLDDVAICQAFISASDFHDRIFLANRFFDYPIVTANEYSRALYNSYHHGGKTKQLFHWLLENADKQDLEIIKNNAGFYRGAFEFQEAVNKTAGVKSRHEPRRQKRVAAAKEALDIAIQNDPFSIIAGYIE